MAKNILFKKNLILFMIFLVLNTAILPTINSKSTDLKYENKNYNSNNDWLDAQYIYNISENLSNIIYTEYNESAGELAKGRFFGSKGEHKAAQILYENMTKLGLYTKMEKINNTEKCPELTHIIDILSYGLKINNVTIDPREFHIVPSKNGPRNDKGNLDYNFSYKGLKVYERPKFLLPWKIRHILDEKKDFVFIEESTAFIPNNTPLIKKLLSKFFNPLRKIVMFSYEITKNIPDLERFYRFFPHCKGIIEYDWHNITYNQGYIETAVPVIYINGTLGNKITSNLKNTSIDFYINQSFNDSVISYNVIGQLNGTNPNKTVIVDCLYDSWWTQGTADAAIGMAMVLAVAKYFKENNLKPKCNIKFIAFCGEEVGLKGAQYYESTHPDENIIYVIDLNQICFWQNGPKLVLNIICNKLSFMWEIWNIVKKTDYEGIVKGTADIKPLWMPFGAPSDDSVFSLRPGCKTVCFLKDTTWLYHHRDGQNHTEGDSMKYFDWDDVNATGEIVLNVVKHFTLDK